MTAHNAPRSKSVPSKKRVVGKKTPARSHAPERRDCDLTRSAYLATLAEEGLSVRSAGPVMFVHHTSAQRIAQNGFACPPIRSKRLALRFVENLRRQVIAAFGEDR